ncbi:ABC transporter ATP-binding protein [Ornithinimicrobium sp. F0845]|uniref:ABC transporter ATP-binding protein n=1 Tax=Ornithinimicrobium sp. F0845 TaxID=2926412 RepID=UPI001FF35E87|nr:ABC transporter ATP-binding protein [Ornithinimicrobium sp. F0845]MCK0111406.1 ABC transporter ATP-binding protein [Ornithinimicrobium sp. F0845]
MHSSPFPSPLPPSSVGSPSVLPWSVGSSSANPSAVLTAQSVTKSYGPTVALAGVALQIGAAESVAVMGASGSGKTTLLHCLAGIIAPDAGAITLLGPDGPQRVDTLGPEGRSRLRRQHYGFVFQQGLLLPELTAVENVALPLLLDGTDRRRAEAEAAHWLAVLGLAGLEARRPGQLSGGQQQRVAVARAQVGAPSVVFADEPTGALDSRTSEQVMTALLETTTGAGRSLVVVTHDERVAASCDRILELRDGLVVHERATLPQQDAHGQQVLVRGQQVAR